MKKIFLFAATAALFAACSSDSGVDSPQTVQTPTDGQEVGFSAYVNRGTTRAGAYGDIATATTLQEGTHNFGVFAYYTNNNDYDQFSIPNFMYNQKVEFTDTDGDSTPDAWTYAPVKYWPNEHGSNAISEDVDRVSFFAYAPYVLVTPSTGKVASLAQNAADETGIVGMSRNSGAGDPLVKYVVSLDPAKKVDLLWGVVEGSSNLSWAIKQGGTQTMSFGLPWMNVQRPASPTTSQKLKFYFDHALAKLNVQIDAAVDAAAPGTPVAANNKIFVRSITFTGFATKGALNLNNTDAGAHTAKWLSFNCVNDLEIGEEVTIYDGRKDGKEGVSASSAEKVTGLNEKLVEGKEWSLLDAAGITGVTNTAQNLFNSATAADAIYVIPTGEQVNVTIVYEVEAAVDNLPTFLADGKQHGSRVLNTITKKNVFSTVPATPVALENGKSYTLNLHLGMNSVKFDATVDPWDDATNHESHLPAN